MIKTKTVHIITFQGKEFDRQATTWEIKELKREGVLKNYNGVLTFDFR